MNNIENLIAVKLNLDFNLLKLISIEQTHYLFEYKNLLIKYFINDYPIFYYVYKNKFKQYYNHFEIIDNIVIIEKFNSSKITNQNIIQIKNQIHNIFNVNITPKVEYIDNLYYNDVEIIEAIIKNTRVTGADGFLMSHLNTNPKYFYHFGCPSCKERFISKENLYRKMIESTRAVINICKERNQKLIYASSMGVYQTKTIQEDYNAYISCDTNTKTIEIFEPEIKDFTRLYNPKPLDVRTPSLYDAKNNIEISENESLQDIYNQYKLECENLIIKELDEYLILRIPRVYGKDSNKGLLNPFRNIYEMERVLSYMDVDDWARETQSIIDTYGIYEYKNLKHDKIKDILAKYKN